jgi:protein-disulfide isomerase
MSATPERPQGNAGDHEAYAAMARGRRASALFEESAMSALKPLRKPAARSARRSPVTRSQATNQRPTIVFLGILAVAAILIAMLVIRGRANDQAEPSDVPVAQAVRPLNAPVGQTSEGFWYKGREDAPVTVIVYGDFQCPACLLAYQQLEDDVDRNYVETGKVKFVFHDFPLAMHANAVPAAQAARAAGAQGKFWAMHDVLYARQAEWENDRNAIRRFKGYAAELGLDHQAFDQAIDEGTYAAAIATAANAGRQQGIKATPTYLVDGQPVETAALIASIDAALKAKGR